MSFASKIEDVKEAQASLKRALSSKGKGEDFKKELLYAQIVLNRVIQDLKNTNWYR